MPSIYGRDRQPIPSFCGRVNFIFSMVIIFMVRGRGSSYTHPRVIELLQKAIAEKGQSIVEKETGLSHSMISRYKRGVGEPSTATLEKLADYFKKPVWWLRGGNTGALSSPNPSTPENTQEAEASFQLFFDTLALAAENKLSKEGLQESHVNIINILVSKYNFPENEAKNFVKRLLDDFKKSLLNFAEKELSKIDAESGNSGTP